MPESERRVAIVTGGARGIGRGCAHAIAQKGVDIVLVDLLEDKLPGTKAEIEAMGVACQTFVADVANHTRAKEIAAEVLRQFGRIDILVNNAGKAQPKGILDLAEDEWDRTIAVNLKSCFNYAQAVAPTMLERRWGRIVSMSSVNAHSGGVTAAVSKFAYASAKAGIIGMTRALAKELGPNIAVKCVCPGLIKTEVEGNAVIRAREPELIKGVAMKRVGTPVDVGNLVAFLATTEPCFITGRDFIIDGFQFNI